MKGCKYIWPDKEICSKCGIPKGSSGQYYTKGGILSFYSCRGGDFPHIPQYTDEESFNVVTCAKCDKTCIDMYVKDNFFYYPKGFINSKKEHQKIWNNTPFGCYISDEDYQVKAIIE